MLDLRVVELYKTSSTSTLRDQIKAPADADANHCVCFGHFDRLHIREVRNNNNILSAIEKDIQRQPSENRNYCYPLYIFHFPDEANNLNQFWDTRLCCMTVSRIHFAPFIPLDNMEDENQSPNSYALQKALKSLSDETAPPDPQECIGDTTVAIGGELVHCVFYHTLELGDLVVVLKSNSMNSCLQVLRRLMEATPVGDIYSYCGVHVSLFLQNKVAEAAKAWDAQGKCPYCRRGVRDSICQPLPHISIRYTVRSVRYAKKFWETLKLPVFFVTGTADALIDLSGQALERVIHVTHVVLSISFNKDDVVYNMYDAFDDIITRIGIDYGEMYQEARDPGQYDTAKLIQQVQNIWDGLSELGQSKERWGNALIAQTNILLTMMNNCVMDDLSMLIWPSVAALMERLRYIFKQKWQISIRQESEIGNFLDCWDILASDIARLESQFTQNPELQSSRYYTPATLMIFYMALLDRYSDFLLSHDGNTHCMKYVPLITYGIEPRTNTMCILDPCMDPIADNNQQIYEGKTPLLVCLPTNLMYKPFQISGILCHELAHYTGDTSRMREKRLDNILLSAAGRISHYWMLDGRPEYPMRTNGSDMVLNSIESEIQSLYQNYCEEKNLGKGHYIYQIQQALPNVLSQVYFSQDLQTSLLTKYLQSSTIYSHFISYAQSFSSKQQNLDFQEMMNSLNNYLLLYRECYADLMAMLCLGLTRSQYLLFMFYAENQYLDDCSAASEDRLCRLHYQAAMVLTAVESLDNELRAPYSDWPPPSKEEEEWLLKWEQHVQYFQTAIDQNEDIWTGGSAPKQLALQAESFLLKDYLNCCAENITKHYKEHGLETSRKQIHDMLIMVSGEPDFLKLHKYITKYRETLFDQQQQ